MPYGMREMSVGPFRKEMKGDQTYATGAGNNTLHIW